MTAAGFAQHTAPASRHRDRPRAYTWLRPFRTLTRTTSDAREPHARASFGSREAPLRRADRRPGPGRRAGDAQGDRLHRRGPRQADRRGRRRPGSRRCPATTTIGASPSAVKAGIRAAGGTPMEFNTISVSDGVSMGTEGMKASLISREVVADSIELVVPRPPLRRRRLHLRLRQDGARRGDGAGPPRHPGARALLGHDLPRHRSDIGGNGSAMRRS